MIGLRPTIVALARVEGRRLLRQPFVLAMAVIAGPLFAALILVAGREAFYYWSLGVPFVPFAVATLVAVNLAALRSRRDGAEDLYRSCPTTAFARTVAISPPWSGRLAPPRSWWR